MMKNSCPMKVLAVEGGGDGLDADDADADGTTWAAAAAAAAAAPCEDRLTCQAVWVSRWTSALQYRRSYLLLLQQLERERCVTCGLLV
jgi:hypothetical protein